MNWVVYGESHVASMALRGSPVDGAICYIVAVLGLMGGATGWVGTRLVVSVLQAAR